MIKRLIFNALVCVMILLFASCGLINTKNPSQGSPGKSDDSGNGSYPRIKYYDGKQGYEWAAALQNARISYTYGEDRSDGNGAVPLPYEFLNCANYHYHSAYSLVGYDEARRGNLDQPDDHIAIVFENGKAILYDFFRMLIVDDYPYWETDEDRAFLPKCPSSAAFSIYEHTKDFEKGTMTRDIVSIYCERFEISVSTDLCDNAKGFELKKKFVVHGQADHTSQYTSYLFTYDPDTGIGLHVEFYIDEDPKIRFDTASGEAYYEYASSLSSVVNLTEYEIGKVTPDDVKSKIAEVMNGHESEYKHISYSEYGDIFA